jgi:hypothetical protein
MIGILKKCLEGTLVGKRCMMGELNTIVAEAAQVFGGRMLSHKWTKKERDVAVGDVVLLAEAENDDPTYRMGVVDSVKPGEDGHVRTVNIRYTNPGKTPEERSPPKITTRPIHKVAVIVPVGYVFEDDHRAEPGGVEPPAPAEASAPEEVTVAQPDPAGDGSAQPGPVEAADADDAHQAQDGTSVGAAGRPEPIMAEKKGPGRPRKEVRADANLSVAPAAEDLGRGDRPRRKAAIRAEENMRRGRNKGPEAWPLLQARANRGRSHQGN